MAVANLTVSRPVIPQPDHSWLDKLAGNLQSVAVNAGAGKIINEDLAARGLAPAPASGGGFLGKLFGGGNQQQPQTAFTGPVTSQQIPGQPAISGRSDLQGATFRPFIDTVRAGGLTNPYGLSAVASTGKAESGWSAANANRTWSDPSESGQSGTAGGIMSWRGPRYQALAATGDLSPEGQARFFLQENPQLIQALNNAGSVEEAQRLMDRAWAYAGHDRPGGEAARRMAMAKSYFASEFGKAPANGGAAAIEAIAPLEQGDTSGTETAYVDPMVRVEPRADAAPYTMASPTAPGQGQAAVQVADSSGAYFPQAPQAAQAPVRVDGDLIRRMVQNPITRERGLALWQEATEGRKMGYDFMMAPNGDLLRTDNQGNFQRLGNFAKPVTQDPTALMQNLKAAGLEPGTPEYRDAILAGTKGGVTVNTGENSSKFQQKSDEEAAKRLNDIVEGGNSAPQMVEDLQTLATLGAQIGTGRQAQVMATIGPWAQALGIDIKSMGEIEAFDAITARLIPQMRPPGSGPQTDADARNLLNSIPTIGKTAEGNRIIVETMQKIQQNKIAAADIASRAYLPKDEGGITWQEAEKQIRALGNPYETFKQYAKTQKGKAPPSAPTPPAPPENPASQRPAVVRSHTDYDRLPSGAEYTDPNGNIRTKR
ncbi:hypothetical protein [Rhizobium rhizogenes]|uniref:hypothetical protein n=1 Tax=Rhizobium rhizogenes TaxID=359 RepID=UPI0022C85000|nr:hypothetical protein [Rhizobium rhizogenes]MCZ7463548.1 hypothetical protein [Rhizobium rhizogenes]